MIRFAIKAAVACSLAALAVGTSVTANAALIMGPSQISASSSLPLYSPAFPVSALADGITAENNALNGFAANANSGIITLDLIGTYDLESFVLWNDVNVFLEGIKDFKLHFYDDANGLLGTSATFVGPQGSLAPRTYTFASPFRGVSKVELQVLSAHVGVVNNIEIREVAFNSAPPIPEPSTWAMLAAGLGVVAAGLSRRAVK